MKYLADFLKLYESVCNEAGVDDYEFIKTHFPKSESYYGMYMQEHPEDETDKLAYTMLKEFADDIKSHNYDIKTVEDIKPQPKQLNEIMRPYLDKLDFRYYWDLIDDKLYAKIISRFVALRNRMAEAEDIELVDPKDIYQDISEKVVRSCLDKICHNVNVLLANAKVCFYRNNWNISDSEIKSIEKIYDKCRFTSNATYGFNPHVTLYRKWARYTDEICSLDKQYLCDSDQGPGQILDHLNSIHFDASIDDMITTMNKCLDVVHFRGNLASAFIKGGEQTCAIVSNLPKDIVF